MEDSRLRREMSDKMKFRTQSERFALGFYQQEGLRYYLRINPLGLITILLLIIIPIIMLLVLWSVNTNTPPPEVNTNIVMPAAASYPPNSNGIKQPSMPTQPKRKRVRDTLLPFCPLCFWFLPCELRIEVPRGRDQRGVTASIRGRGTEKIVAAAVRNVCAKLFA